MWAPHCVSMSTLPLKARSEVFRVQNSPSYRRLVKGVRAGCCYEQLVESGHTDRGVKVGKRKNQ